MKVRTILALAVILGVLGSVSMGVCDDSSAASGPVAFLPEKIFEFEPVLGGKEVIHDFVIRNKGDALLKIEAVKTG